MIAIVKSYALYYIANLIAGACDSTAVYRSAEPLAAESTISKALALKRPGGARKALVAWARSDAVTETSGHESAFAISRNKSKNFNDINLMDTSLTNLRDVVVSAEGSVVYLTTNNGADLSLWRRSLSWVRVLSK